MAQEVRRGAGLQVPLGPRQARRLRGKCAARAWRVVDNAGTAAGRACTRARVRAFARSRVRATGKLVVATRPESLLQRGRYVCCAREICLLRVRAVWVELLVVVARAPAAILSRSGSPEAHTVRYLPFHTIPYHHQPSHASRSGSRARLVRLTRILVDRRRPARLPF